VGRDSSVGIATRYGLDGPGIESRRGGGLRDFHTCPDRPWGTPSLLYNGYRVFPEGKAVRAWRSPPTPSSSEVKERVQILLPLWAFVAFSKMNFTLPTQNYRRQKGDMKQVLNRGPKILGTLVHNLVLRATGAWDLCTFGIRYFAISRNTTDAQLGTNKK
jgi:hypothetical protein